MKQEPVAWIINGKLFEEYFRTSELDKIIPLYTAPPTIQTRVKYGNPDTLETGWITIETPAPKQLSDEEMNEIIQVLNQSRINWSGNEFIKEAMRLAIKKAGEK